MIYPYGRTNCMLEVLSLSPQTQLAIVEAQIPHQGDVFGHLRRQLLLWPWSPQ